MADLLSKLSSMQAQKPIEPREIFMSLPRKDKQYDYPRDVQTEVWKKWFENRDRKNNIVKMNTGSGKTVVGLIMLQSCLNEGKGPAVYVVPDKYLVTQVCNEAKKLGIQVTENRDNYLYAENKSILVMPIHKLVNGRSVFGMRVSKNYTLGSVLIDDVHSCLDTISSQFSVQIPAKDELYGRIIASIAEQWKDYNSASYTNIVELKDPTKTALVPFWIWQDKAEDIYRLLVEHNNDQHPEVFFPLPLLEDNLLACNCVITSRTIEITPYGIDISKIKEFENAQRRIFMSATLSDDSVFVSNIGLKESDVDSIIVPDNANDIGDRLILFPRHLNNAISDDEIKEYIFKVAEKHNVVVLVPSRERALFWDPSGERTVSKDNIEQAVLQLKDNHVGVAVFLNRYDGIDLPDDACRMLVIDGLPPLKSEYEKYIQSIDPASSILMREQIQRIEQGMGRGVRSNSDSCCVILMGDNLADVLVRHKGTSYFSNATLAQYSLSKELWDLLIQDKPTPDIEDIFELADYSLNRAVEWIQMSKERLSTVRYSATPKVDDVTIALRKAYDYSRVGQWQKAADEIDAAYNSDIEESTKGYLLQIKAGYTNFLDKVKAQQILKAAYEKNHSVLTPIEGIQYTKSINNVDQAKAICDYASRIALSPNEYVVHVKAVLAKLEFTQDTDGFEQAMEELGSLLGFESTRPDKETRGAGPDNLWAIGKNEYFVIECKSGATATTISKEYCNQLGGSVRWFESEYGAGYICRPIMVHQFAKIHKLATPVKDMRVITPACTQKLKKQISDFVTALTRIENWKNIEQVQKLLKTYRLESRSFVEEYTDPAIEE